MNKRLLLFIGTLGLGFAPIAASQAQSCVGTATLQVTIEDAPAVPTITVDGSGNLVSSSSTGNQWFLNGSPIEGANNQTHNPELGGSYTVEVTVDGCSAVSEVYLLVGTNTLNTAHAALTLYPNPATVSLMCRIELPAAETVALRVFNKVGQLVYQSPARLQAGNNELLVPTADSANRCVHPPTTRQGVDSRPKIHQTIGTRKNCRFCFALLSLASFCYQKRRKIKRQKNSCAPYFYVLLPVRNPPPISKAFLKTNQSFP